MYQNVLLAVQCNSNYLTPSFPSYVGVRQGDNLSPTLFNIFINDIPLLFKDCAPPSFGQMTIPCLLYADDLLVFSESDSGLNNALSKLNRYCETWGLEVNTTKTKYICLNPDKNIPSPKISFGMTAIENVQSFTYLGIEFSSDGSFNIAKKILYKKALKVYFKISKTLKPSPQVDTMLHLFDHLIKPILMYGSEIWGVSNLNFKIANPKPGDSKSQFYCDLKNLHPITSKFIGQDDPIEKMHLKFCKYTLGVHGKATNLGVYGDLGRYPLFITNISHCLNYFYHLQFSKDNVLLQDFFKSLQEEQTVCKHSIVNFSHTLHKVTKTTVTNNEKNVKYTVNRIVSAIKNEFISYWKKSVETRFSGVKSKSGGNKLRTYTTFKSCFKKESYLNLKDPKLRRCLAKFRLSAHRLKIETDRFIGNKGYIKPEDRLCKTCTLSVVENEQHFLIKCPAYADLRNKLFSSINLGNPHFINYSEENKFLWLMSSENLQDLKLTAEFIHQAMHLRSTL